VSQEEHHPDPTRRDESVSRGVGRACIITIWGVVALGYGICYVIERYYGYAMYYGMVVFLFPAIIVTILYTIARVTGWLMSRRPEPVVMGK
jgi:hypothetical protein